MVGLDFRIFIGFSSYDPKKVQKTHFSNGFSEETSVSIPAILAGSIEEGSIYTIIFGQPDPAIRVPGIE